ncbi:MAG: hypothetical protein H7258_06860 [Ferruginibacter sp.]|nr:hypothetical protein [Ferruginibacter sp.]
MKPDYILKATLLDILFENRNKAYGAYPIRKYYHERIYKSLGIMFLTAIALALFVFLKTDNIRMNIPVKDIWIVDVFKPPIDQQKPKESFKKPAVSITPTAPQAPQKPVIVTAAGPIVITKDGGKFEAPVSPGNNPAPRDVQLGANPLPPFTAAPSLPEREKSIDKNIPLNTADIMPAYPGGMEALQKFLERNLTNPTDIEQGESIAVKIKFIVGYDGVLKGFETIEDGGSIFNNEVIRVLKKMPQWIPGKSHGENVSVYYCIPVEFMATGL